MVACSLTLSLPLGLAHVQICFVQLLKAHLLKFNNAIQVPTVQQITMNDTRTFEREQEKQTQQLQFPLVEFICMMF